jgi:F-box domain.
MIGCFALNEGNEALESISTDKENTVLEKQLSDLPCLVTDKIFGYLNRRDLGRCAQVCKSWNSMVFHPALWRKIHPIMWARGMYLTVVSFYK